jgi:hypothetical protein
MHEKTAEPKRWIDSLHEQLTTPVDRKTFEFAVGLFQAAAAGAIPDAHLLKPDPEKPGLYLTNIPINRGMLAVMRETRHLTDAQRQGISLRLMYFGEVVEAAATDSRFSEHVKRDDDGCLLVSGAFQGAYAACDLQMDDNSIGPNWDHLLQLLPEMERD